MQLKDNKYYGTFDGALYVIQDDVAAQFYSRWQQLTPEALVMQTLKDVAYWGADLSQLPHFQQAVTEHLQNILSKGMIAAIHHLQNKTEIVA